MKVFPAGLVCVFLSAWCAACAEETAPAAVIETSAAVAAQDMSGGVIEPQTRVAPETMADVKMSFAPIVERVAPAVVNIYTKRQVNRSTGDPLFDRFFGAGSQEQRSLGSGVIVAPDGVIVTNNHVIERMTEITVVFADRREFAAELLLADPKTDLAVLRIDVDEPLPFLEFANDDAAEVGDIVLAIGNPFGVGQTVTNGIVSALARTAVSISDYQFFIQTDAAINPGNSGGALVDVDGRLLGVNTAIFSRSGGSNGIGFAIPSRLVQQVISQAVRGGEIYRPWVGAATETVTASLAQALKLDRPAGALLNDLYKDGPLERAGLRSGDVVVEVDGKPVFDAPTLRYRIGVTNPGDEIWLAYIRDGRRFETSAKMELAPETIAPDERLLSGNHPLDSVKVANLSPRFNEEKGLDPLLTGIVVTEVGARSYARRSRLRAGYRILSVNGKDVGSVADLERQLSRTTSPWTIEVDTGDRVVPWRVGR